MVASNSTRRRRARKPKQSRKPHPDFPLTPHPSGRWCKKIRGRLHYFGKLGEPEVALARWLEQKDDLLAGRTPRPAQAGLTLRELFNRFLSAKQQAVETKLLTSRSWSDYYTVCGQIINEFGTHRLVSDLGPEDFARLRTRMAKGVSAITLANRILRARVPFNYAEKAGLVPHRPRFGPDFQRPPMKVLRLERLKRGKKLFTAPQIRALVRFASPGLKAMILLGINCGMGNADCGRLELSHLHLAGAWMDYPREKTGISRRIPLWPETVQAVRVALERRPTPKKESLETRVFLTKYGQSWFKEDHRNPLSYEFRKLLRRLKLRRGGFYWLRHTFETVAGTSRDQVAINAVMGHVDQSMAADYREGVQDDRLKRVVDEVRSWLFKGTYRTN